jgi:hypothetical protein
MSSVSKNEKNTFGILVTTWVVSILVALILARIIILVFWLCCENAFGELPEEEVINAIEILTMGASIVYALIYWMDTLETQTEGRLLFLKMKMNVILGPGPYLLPFNDWGLFTIFRSEVTDTQARDVQLDPYPSQDNSKKKIIIEGDGDWEVSNYANFEHFDGQNMKKNLTSLVKKTATRVFGGKSFEGQLHGQELGDDILNDPSFLRECSRFGVKFSNLMVTVTSGNPERDDILQFEERLFNRFKSRYPDPNNLTEEDLAEINRMIDTKLGLAQRYIVDGASSYGKFNMGTNGSD